MNTWLIQDIKLFIIAQLGECRLVDYWLNTTIN